MTKLLLALATLGLVGADAVASDPFAPSQTPSWFEKRADTALLFESSDRQSALADSLASEPAQRYAAFANTGSPRLRFGALPANMALLDPLGPLLNEHSKRFLSSAEFEKKMGRGTGIFTIGILREAGGVPGTQHSMSMVLNARPTTTFTSLSLGYALTDQLVDGAGLVRQDRGHRHAGQPAVAGIVGAHRRLQPRVCEAAAVHQQ
jgi:hypothetical protein